MSLYLFDRERVPSVSVILAIVVVWGWVDAVEIVADRSDFDLEGDPVNMVESEATSILNTRFILVASWLAHLGVHRHGSAGALPPEFIHGSRLSSHVLCVFI